MLQGRSLACYILNRTVMLRLCYLRAQAQCTVTPDAWSHLLRPRRMSRLRQRPRGRWCVPVPGGSYKHADAVPGRTYVPCLTDQHPALMTILVALNRYVSALQVASPPGI